MYNYERTASSRFTLAEIPREKNPCCLWDSKSRPSDPCHLVTIDFPLGSVRNLLLWSVGPKLVAIAQRDLKQLPAFGQGHPEHANPGE